MINMSRKTHILQLYPFLHFSFTAEIFTVGLHSLRYHQGADGSTVPSCVPSKPETFQVCLSFSKYECLCCRHIAIMQLRFGLSVRLFLHPYFGPFPFHNFIPFIMRVMRSPVTPQRMGSAAQSVLVIVGQCVRQRHVRRFYSHHGADADIEVILPRRIRCMCLCVCMCEWYIQLMCASVQCSTCASCTHVAATHFGNIVHGLLLW